MVCQETLLQYEESAEALETWCHNITPFDFRHLSTGFGIKAFASESRPINAINLCLRQAEENNQKTTTNALERLANHVHRTREAAWVFGWL